jgi:hypothetical protein
LFVVRRLPAVLAAGSELLRLALVVFVGAFSTAAGAFARGFAGVFGTAAGSALPAPLRRGRAGGAGWAVRRARVVVDARTS